jgi:hypothetical protein
VADYEDFFNKASSKPISTPKGSATTASVAKGLESLNSALIRSPQVMASGNYEEFFNRAANIASGKPKEQGGILGSIGGGAMKVLEGAGYALGAPARVVASAAQETKDFFEGEMPSLKDFVSQAGQKDFYLSKVFTVDTGTDWLDTALNLGVDILGDPLTYVGVGAVANVGRGGRVALAEKAATIPNLFKAEDIAEIARHGQFARLSKAQQSALDIQHGLRYQFGKQGLIFDPETVAGRTSAVVGQKVGRGVTTVRANIGDVLLPTRVREVITPRSYRILGDLGRKNATTSGANLIARVAAHSSSVAERANQNLFESVARGEARALFDEATNSPYRATIYQVIDGTREAVDAAEADLAGRMKAFVDKIQGDANDYVNEVNGRRGINASVIETIDDYGIKRSLTPEARNWVNSSKGRQSKSSTVIAEATGLTKQEFISGPDITRMRRLTKDSEFLGETLNVGSVDEINEIAERKLGFKWFETDAPFLMSDYISSASKTVGRVAFVDRLLDFSPEIVDKLLYKIVPTEGVANLSATVKALLATREGIAKSIDILDDKGLKIVDGTLARAEAELAQGVARSKELISSRRVLQRNVKKAEQALAKAEAQAATAAGEARAAYETVLQPLRTRIAYLRNAIDSADSMERSAMEVLAPIHQRILPDAPVPNISADVYNSIGEALLGRVTTLEARAAAGEAGLGRQIAAAKGQVTKFVNQNESIVDAAIAADVNMPVRGRPVVGDVRSASVLEGPVPSLQTIDYEAAKKELRRADALLAREESKFEKAISTETKKALKEPLKARTRAITALDNNKALTVDQRLWERQVRPALQDLIDELRATSTMGRVAQMRFEEVSAETFHRAINDAGNVVKGGQPTRLTLTVYPVEEYANMRTFLSVDGKTGYAVKPDGDLVSVFNVGPKGAGEMAVLDGIWNSGALKLDAYAQVSDMFPEGYLVSKYRKYGFVEYERLKWDNDYAPDGWDVAVNGEPDVVFMYLETGANRNVERATARTRAIEGDTGSARVSGRGPSANQGLPDGVSGGVGTGGTNVSGAGTQRTAGPRRTGSNVPAEYTQEWLNRTNRLLNQINNTNILNANQKKAWDKVFTSLQANEVTLAKAEAELAYNAGMRNLLTPPVSGPFSIDDLPPSFYGNIERDIREGWAAIEGLGIQMPKELADLLFGRIADLGTKQGFTEMFDIFKKFNQFFRVTAMLTPGFIVRNSYTAAFNNFVFGCTLRDTDEGIRFATVLHRRGAKAALDSLPEAGRETTELAYKAVLAAGLNQTEDIIQPVIQATRQSRLLNNRVVQAWSTGNQDVETAVRMTLALRAAKNGMNLDEITAAVSRYHFNYADLSTLDEYAKVFLPFWTFASRNIPLQITNQIMRPSVYRAYEGVQRSYPPDENLIMPEWLARREPLGFGRTGVLNPDLPQIDMADQIRQFSDPLRLLGQFYPQYRLIPELAGNRMYSTGVPFSNKLQPIRGPLDYPSALLGMLTGQTVQTAEGPALTAKGAYVLPNVLPTLGTLQRLLPQLGGQEKYVERQGSSIAGSLGIPYREVTPEEQERTLTGREIELQNLLRELQKRGYVG